MTVFPLDWHRKCLENAEQHLARQKAEMSRTIAMAQANIDRLSKDVLLARSQIAEAERRGIVAFDGNRFMKKRNGVGHGHANARGCRGSAGSDLP